MKKLLNNLPFRLLLGIVIGIILGQVFPLSFMRVVVTLQYIMGQLITFCVPLIIIGFIAPSITKLGKNASRLLGVAVVIAYVSSICAAFMSTGAGYALIPHLSIDTEVAGLRELPGVVFELNIPQIMSVMSALVLSVLVGLAATWTNSKLTCDFLAEFQNIVLDIVSKIIIPLLPFYIFTMICEMSAAGHLSTVMGTGIKVIATGVILSICYLIIQYIIAGLIAKKNPFKCIWNIIPAYLTGFSICSSSAVIPVTLECTMKNGATKEIANFTIPLCSTVHMCGSTIKLITTSVAVMYLSGMNISFALFVNFILLQGISAVAAPGVMGGVLMASIGLLESVLGFSPEQSALMMTIYLALDGYGPACNVSGDGAITLIIDRFFAKKYASAQQ